MTQKTGETRYFKATAKQEVIFSHDGSDKEVVSYAEELGASAVNGLLGQHPEVHFVTEEVDLVELGETREL